MLLKELVDLLNSIEEQHPVYAEPVGIHNGVLYIEINGKRYGYIPDHETGMSVAELARKFDKMQKYSHGKAIAWLKKVSKVVYGGLTKVVGQGEMGNPFSPGVGANG